MIPAPTRPDRKYFRTISITYEKEVAVTNAGCHDLNTHLSSLWKELPESPKFSNGSATVQVIASGHLDNPSNPLSIEQRKIEESPKNQLVSLRS